MTLVVMSLDAGATLGLRDRWDDGPSATTLLATPASPAVLRTSAAEPCGPPEFSVLGLSASAAVPYRAEADCHPGHVHVPPHVFWP